VGVDAVRFEVAFRYIDQLGGDALPLQVLGRPDVAALVDREDPLVRAHSLLGIDEVRDLDHIGLALLDPVKAGEARVEDAVGDVAGHFLGAQEHGPDLGVVEVRRILALIDGDLEAGLLEDGDCGGLETALGKAEAKLVAGRQRLSTPCYREVRTHARFLLCGASSYSTRMRRRGIIA